MTQQSQKDSGPQQEGTNLKPGVVLHQIKPSGQNWETDWGGQGFMFQMAWTITGLPKIGPIILMETFPCETQAYPSSSIKHFSGPRESMPAIATHLTIVRAVATADA